MCYRQYGRSGYALQVYELNPGLAEYGPRLPAGLIIQLPEISKPETPELPKISLFD
ncbi:tail protein X [Streptomyces scabiei]|uniref:tail protein X n=1 Tax=Streptomyces TaxID=1883 RepID=UPI0038F80507